MAAWLSWRTNESFHSARDTVRAGRALRDHLPVTLEAGLDGQISMDQVRTMVTVAATSPTRCQALAGSAAECGEAFLVEQAKDHGAQQFRDLTRRWAAAADVEADERGFKQASDREYVTLAPTTGGYHLAGFLTTEHGALIDAALNTVTPPYDMGHPSRGPQRRAEALTNLAHLVLDQGLVATGSSVRPHLNVVVDYDTLHRALGIPAHRGTHEHGSGDAFGRTVSTSEEADVVAGGAGDASQQGSEPGSFHLRPIADVERFATAAIIGAGPIPPSLLARLACDCTIDRIIFGADSKVINVGRDERVYRGTLRQAIIARDQHCRYPGCTVPPVLGEIHHTQQWARDHGDTDVNTGVLLCWHHHTFVHERGIEITPTPTGGWQFHTPTEQHAHPAA